MSTLRSSFRKLKDKREQHVQSNTSAEGDEKSVLPGGNCCDNTFLVTIWICDRKRLGLKLGGGNVSPYGDSNIHVLEIKKAGTARKVFNVGDEILEIDGKSTLEMDICDANNLLKTLEGNYVQFKVFRPTKK